MLAPHKTCPESNRGMGPCCNLVRGHPRASLPLTSIGGGNLFNDCHSERKKLLVLSETEGEESQKYLAPRFYWRFVIPPQVGIY